jgi:hypothetical protein
MINNREMNVKISLAEYLTHDSYMVQLGRITGKMKNRIEKVLTVFEITVLLRKKHPYSGKKTKNYLLI